MTETNAAKVANGEASSGDADVDAISSPDPRANGAGGEDDPNADRARRMGWQPQEKYRGPKDKWLPASDFIEKVEGEIPVLRERNRFLDTRLAKQDAELEEIKKVSKEQAEMLREMLDKSRETEQRQYTYTVRELEAAMDKAAREGDQDNYMRFKSQLMEIGKYQPKATPEKKVEPAAEKKPDGGPPQLSPAVQDFIRENPWFTPSNPDDEATQYAMDRDRWLKKTYPNETERFRKVREDVEKRFPEKFDNPARKQAAAVNSPGAHANGKAKKGKTVADLDEHAKTALAKFKRTIPGYTDKEFLDTYQWDKS